MGWLDGYIEVEISVIPIKTFAAHPPWKWGIVYDWCMAWLLRMDVVTSYVCHCTSIRACTPTKLSHVPLKYFTRMHTYSTVAQGPHMKTICSTTPGAAILSMSAQGGIEGGDYVGKIEHIK